jgi:predicted HTH domain antitoxin
LGTPNELEVEFPGFSERMEWIKIALITKAMGIIAIRKAAELAAIEASKNTTLIN